MVIIFVTILVVLTVGAIFIAGILFSEEGASRYVAVLMFVGLAVLVALASVIWIVAQNNVTCKYKGGKYDIVTNSCHKVGSTIDLSK